MKVAPDTAEYAPGSVGCIFTIVNNGGDDLVITNLGDNCAAYSIAKDEVKFTQSSFEAGMSITYADSDATKIAKQLIIWKLGMAVMDTGAWLKQIDDSADTTACDADNVTCTYNYNTIALMESSTDDDDAVTTGGYQVGVALSMAVVSAFLAI